MKIQNITNQDIMLNVAYNNITILMDEGNIRVADVKFEYDNSHYYLNGDELYKDAVKYLHSCAEYLSSLSPDELNAKATIDRYEKTLIIDDIAIGFDEKSYNDIKGTVDWFVNIVNNISPRERLPID